MNKTKLINSGVTLNEDTHEYTLNGTPLLGITSTLIPAIFGDYTAKVPRKTLAAAAERGTNIHKTIELINDIHAEATTYESKEYVRLISEAQLTYRASEYIVTDYQHFASPIDIVFDNDIIADIKTTNETHYPEWTFQLSWYAAMYERINNRKVSKAYVIYLPKEGKGNARLIEVNPVNGNIIDNITRAFLDNDDCQQYKTHFLPRLTTRRPLDDILNDLSDARRIRDDYETTIRQYEDELTDAFNALPQGVDSYKDNHLTITRIPATTRTTIDGKKLQQLFPDQYAMCCKVNTIKEQIRITIK